MQKKEEAIIFLSAQSLILLKKKEKAFLKITSDVINYRKIVNKQKFRQLTEDFLSKEKIKGVDFYLVLANELTFTKKIPLTRVEDTQKEYDKFFLGIPFPSSQVASIRNYREKELVVFAVYRDLFLLLDETLSSLEAKMKKALPFSVLGIKNLTYDDLPVVEKPPLFPSVNFLSERARVSSPGQKKKRKRGKKGLALWVMGIFALVAFLLSGSFFLSRYFQKTQEDSLSFQKPPVVKTESLSAQPETVKREDISIQILNRSGVENGWVKIKTAFGKAGFENIIQEDLPAERGGSVIQFGPRMEAVLAKEVIDVVKGVKTLTEEATSSAKTDVVIILRK